MPFLNTTLYDEFIDTNYTSVVCLVAKLRPRRAAGPLVLKKYQLRYVGLPVLRFLNLFVL